jgi:hypothetical protein
MSRENPFQKEPQEGTDVDLTPFRKGVIGKKLSEGSHASVHELDEFKGSPSLVKIGKTENYSPPILKRLRLSFEREKVSKFLEKLLGPEFKIMPDEDFIRNGVAEYFLMKKYFGADGGTDENGERTAARRPKGEKEDNARDRLIRALEDKDDPFYKDILASLGDERLLEEILDAVRKHRTDNFLPKEQVVIGHPPTVTKQQFEESTKPEPRARKKLPATYYIIQERAVDRTGKDMLPLYELDDRELLDRPALVERLLTFAMLAKKMYADTGKLIDTRPEEIGKHPLEWFQKTANILVDKEAQDLRFVDTRWLWSGGSKLGAKGALNLIEYFGVRSVDRAIKKYAELLRKAEIAAQEKRTDAT